ncbi:MAG: hypothetical protein EOM12_16455 [Verrucomicrobiae bacterium]|nr:hypothetical protein [Verrucomicrobiae bacterium]
MKNHCTENIALFLSCIVVYSCGCQRNDSFIRRFRDAIRGEKNYVQLVTLTEETWDEVVIFPPYATKELLSSEVGHIPEDIEWYRQSEVYYLLCFVRSNTLVRIEPFPRTIGDFEVGITNNRFAVKDAIFTIEQRKVEAQGDKGTNVYRKYFVPLADGALQAQPLNDR